MRKTLLTLCSKCLPCGYGQSKDVLQCELHDPRIERRPDLAEEAIAYLRERSSTRCKRGRRITGMEAVGHIKCVRADLDSLPFSNPEGPGEGDVELPRGGLHEIVPVIITDCP